MLGETPPGSRPASQPGDPDMNDAMFPLKNPPKSKEGWSARADPTDIDTGGRCKSCKKCCHRVLKFFGHDPNAANKYAWVESDFESANLKNKGVRCKALETYPNPASKDPTLREALPHDLHFTKDAVIIIIERPAEPGVLWRGYLETDEKKLDGNINPLLVDMDGVQQHRERPLDLSESDDEEDAEVEAQFIALDKEVRENAKEVNAQLTGEGGVKLEDLWGAEEEDTTLNHKDKDAILKLKEKIEVRDVYATQHPPLAFAVLQPIALSRRVNGPRRSTRCSGYVAKAAQRLVLGGARRELEKLKNESKRLRDERNKYMSQSTSLNDRISTAHKASEEIAPWIQRDVQQALDLLRRQEEISLPAAHRHAAVIERLDKQEKCAAVFLRCHPGTPQS